jgi:hypothetical protein
MKKPHQLEFEIGRHGGMRKGAGRPKVLRNEPGHAKRGALTQRAPLMLTVKMAQGAPSLRSPKFMKRLGRSIRLASAKGLHINQYAIERDHLHFMAEAESNEALERGMQSFIASLKWALRDNFHYYGKVLRGRFHTLICATPRQVRNALRYVLFNHAKHCGQWPFVDEFSSAATFAEIHILAKISESKLARWTVELPEPRSWLQRVGWKRAT